MLWYRQKIDMLYGAAGIFILSGWLVTNSFLYPFIFGHYFIDGIINYMFCLMIPFCLILYLDSLQNDRYRKYMVIFLSISTVNAFTWTILHFTGIMNFFNALIYIDIVLGIMSIVALVIGIIEILILTFLTLKLDDIPMLIGLTFLLILIVVQQVEDLRNISLEKQRAIDLSDAKTRFLANMSHEIRTPINSILGMNEMILKENKDTVIDGYAGAVRNSGGMLLTLVNDVLDFSKIESGKLEIANTDYSLSKVLRDILPIISERAQIKALDLTVEIKGGSDCSGSVRQWF